MYPAPMPSNTMSQTPERDERQFAEEIGLYFEQSGLPRMAGRILGRLLLCDPPAQTAQQLSEALEASMGAISTMSRLLIQLGFLERVTIPGKRAARLRIRPESWADLMLKRMHTVTLFRKHVEHGLTLVKGKGPAVRHRLEEVRDLYRFLEVEMPRLLERWQRGRKGREAGRG